MIDGLRIKSQFIISTNRFVNSSSIIVTGGKIAMSLESNANEFKLIGGNQSLDFANTVGGRSANPNKKGGRDYKDFYLFNRLEDYAHLVAWSLAARILDKKTAKHLLRRGADESQSAGKVWKRAIILRESVYRLFKSIIEDWQPDDEDLENLNRELSIARAHQRLSSAKDGYHYVWVENENSLDSMLWQISEATAEMLSGGDLTRIRHCGNETCNWLFFDASRNRSRQWCDMKDCGNLAKVRRFRRKK